MKAKSRVKPVVTRTPLSQQRVQRKLERLNAEAERLLALDSEALVAQFFDLPRNRRVTVDSQKLQALGVTYRQLEAKVEKTDELLRLVQDYGVACSRLTDHLRAVVVAAREVGLHSCVSDYVDESIVKTSDITALSDAVDAAVAYIPTLLNPMLPITGDGDALQEAVTGGVIGAVTHEDEVTR